MLYLHPAISHVCNNCIRPFVMSLTVAPNQQSCLLNLHIYACMSEKLAPGPVLVFIFVIEISNHLCCLLHLHQTSIVVMVVTTAPNKQAYSLQFLISSRNVFNGYIQPAVMMAINICSMQIYLLLVGLLIHCIL